jgi:hypothetical protein
VGLQLLLLAQLVYMVLAVQLTQVVVVVAVELKTIQTKLAVAVAALA